MLCMQQVSPHGKEEVSYNLVKTHMFPATKEGDKEEPCVRPVSSEGKVEPLGGAVGKKDRGAGSCSRGKNDAGCELRSSETNQQCVHVGIKALNGNTSVRNWRRKSQRKER